MSRRRALRRDDDRGVALVELAIVISLLSLILSGIIDIGMGWRRSVETSGTLRSGVRVLAQLGDERSSDLDALKALNAGIAEIGASNVLRVILYESSDATGNVPATCKAVIPSSAGAGVTDVCNVYNPTQLAALSTATANFSGSTTACQSDDWDRFWCPVQDRQASQGASGGADYVGIWIEVRYDWIVGLLPGTGLTIHDDAVMRIEPSL